MPDFDDDLRSLAGHGQRTGRLDPAATIRRRADRRRRGRYVATGALGVLAAGALTIGIAVTRPDALPPNPPATSQSASAVPSPTTTAPSSPSPSSAPPSPAPPSASSTSPTSPSKAASTSTSTSSSGGVFSGTRQVWLLPKVSEGTVAVDESMNAGLSEAFDDRALFVLSPNGSGRYSIKTAKLRVNDDPANETFCLAVKSGKVIAAACDAGDSNQLFYIIKSGTTGTDKPTYVIRTRDYVFLRVADLSADLTASKIDEGTADAGTDFLLPDKGKASLPALD